MTTNTNTMDSAISSMINVNQTDSAGNGEKLSTPPYKYTMTVTTKKMNIIRYLIWKYVLGCDVIKHY